MIEVHDHPDRALSDGVQSILPDEFAQLREECAQIAQVLGRKLN
jgi:3-deoxy-7-phosphoheptulonate synthase